MTDSDHCRMFAFFSPQVIKGWDIGVSTMRIGEVATLFIKAHYGYGSAGSPPKVCFITTTCFFLIIFQIPGDATLVFEIELFDFHGEDISKVFLSLNFHDTSGSLESFCSLFIKFIRIKTWAL